MVDLLNDPFIKAITIDDLPEAAWQYLAGGAQGSDLKTYYQKVPWLFRGVDIRANAVASMPFAIYKGEDQVDSSEDYQNALRVLPNPGVFFGLIEAALVMWGYAYAFKAPNLYGVAQGLRYLLPTSVTVKINPESGEPQFKRNVNGKATAYSDKEMMYFWKPDPFVEIGPPLSSPATAASAAAGVALNVDKFAEAFFARGAIKATLLTTKGRVIPQEREKIKSWWKRLFSGVERAWETDIVNADAVEAVQVGEGIESLNNESLTMAQREAIATALGIPHSVLFSNAANYAVSEQDDLHFYKKTIVPECEFIASVVNDQLYAQTGHQLKFQPETLDVFQEDENERASSLATLVGVLEQGEVVQAAMNILGYEVDPETQKLLEKLWAEKAQRREQMAGFAAQGASERADQGAPPSSSPQEGEDDAQGELRTWRRWALGQVEKKGAIGRAFNTEHVGDALAGAIDGMLQGATTAAEVNAVFDSVWAGYP